VILIANRILNGFAESTLLPSQMTMNSKWIPTRERTFLVTIIFAGEAIGGFIGFIFSGVLIDVDSPYLGGWTGVFNIAGILGILFSIIWLFIVEESPHTHKNINKAEK